MGIFFFKQKNETVLTGPGANFAFPQSGPHSHSLMASETEVDLNALWDDLPFNTETVDSGYLQRTADWD